MNLNQYRENILMALDTLRSHKLRSALTVLGVIIGVLTVIVIASILTGMRSNIVSLVEEYGTHNIYAFHLSTGPRVGPRARREWQREPLTVEDAKALKDEAWSLAEVSYRGFFFGSPNVQYRGNEYRRGQLEGVAPEHGSVMNISLAEGRFITRGDDLHRNHASRMILISPLRTG